MGNREDLLRGAAKSLLDVGYARSTAREIAARAGTSLAAIGYHYGSTENLLRAAITEGFREWRAVFASALDEAEQSGGDALRSIGAALDELFASQRRLFAVFLEAIVLADRDAEVETAVASAVAEDRLAVAALIARTRGRAGDGDALLASMLIAVVDGLFIQHLLDRDAPPPSAALELFRPLITGRRARAGAVR